MVEAVRVVKMVEEGTVASTVAAMMAAVAEQVVAEGSLAVVREEVMGVGRVAEARAEVPLVAAAVR